MTVSASISLQQGGGTLGLQSDILQALSCGFFGQDAQRDYRINHEIRDTGHRVDVGLAPAGNRNEHFSAERQDNGGHLVTSSSVGQTYRREDVKNATSRGRKRHLTPQCVDSAIGPIIRNRSIKTVARASGRSTETVKRWRTMLPEAFAAFVNLLTYDDDVYLAVMELAGRKPAAALSDDQKRAVAEALKLLGVE